MEENMKKAHYLEGIRLEHAQISTQEWNKREIKNNTAFM